MSKRIFEELNKASWKEWIENLEITAEQLEKLKTKHTNYAIKPIATIDGTVIQLKYRVIFLQGKEETQSVDLKVYSINASKNELIGGIIENWNILIMIIDKIDEYRGDGRKSKKPDWKEFFRMYERFINKADGKEEM